MEHRIRTPIELPTHKLTILHSAAKAGKCFACFVLVPHSRSFVEHYPAIDNFIKGPGFYRFSIHMQHQVEMIGDDGVGTDLDGKPRRES